MEIGLETDMPTYSGRLGVLAGDTPRSNEQDAEALFDKLENTIIPLYYNQPSQFQNIMAHCIALNGSFFNTQRMVQQYVLKAYFE